VFDSEAVLEPEHIESGNYLVKIVFDMGKGDVVIVNGPSDAVGGVVETTWTRRARRHTSLTNCFESPTARLWNTGTPSP
jgi:hypothetical protein